MKKLLLLLVSVLPLAAYGTGPTHQRLVDSKVHADHDPPVVAALPPLVPVRMYVADWDGNGGYQISPDGRQLMWSARKGLNQGLFVKTLETGLVHSYALPWRGIWAEDSRHILFNVHNGDENSSVLQLDSFTESVELRNLTPFPGSKSSLHAKIDGSDDLLIESNKRDAKVFDLYRYRATTGALELLAENPGTVRIWLTDRTGNPAARVRMDESRWLLEIARISGPNTEWTESFKAALSDTVVPLQMTNVPLLGWALSNRNRDKMALVLLDLETGAEDVVFSDPRVDVSQAFISRASGKPFALSLEPDLQELRFFEPRLQALVTKVMRPENSRLDLVSTSRDERYLILAQHDSHGGRYVLLDTATQVRVDLGELSSTRINAISPLPKQVPIAFLARDGLVVHGYLTRPIDVNGRDLSNAPTVVLVHGGPWARDYGNADNMPYFLANRGYAVLQVNYRGSSGYGKAFQEAAKRELAGKMHTDLLDGVDYLVQQGIADSAKVAIMGASYGGYASLVGMTHTPGRFVCGISLFGMSDIPTLITDAPPYWTLELFRWYDLVGDPASPDDLQRMRDSSPLYKANQVRGSVLILQGALDARVHLDQSTRMVEALKKAGRTVDFVLFPNAGHHLNRWIDRLTYYRKTEDFLAQCLGGRSNGYDFFELGSMIF